MTATIPQIIGKINPKLYSFNRSELLKEYGSAENIPAEKIKPQSIRGFEKQGVFKFEPLGFESSHTIIYDSSSETLEPLYFWVLDMMENVGLEVEKLVDNFTSAPGSGHFSELGGKTTAMQQQGQNMLAQANTILRSVLNIVYDLKEFKIRLQSYDDIKSDDKSVQSAARLSLKQIWMDKVDIQKSNSSIKAMALGQAGFQTLLDAFLVVDDEKSVDKIDLNERVKRILKPRIQEFNVWIEQSERELRKRYALERIYLKSQVNSLKMYSRWAKPYLKAAFGLEQKEQGRNPDIVKTFNSIILELTLFGKSEVSPPAELGKLSKTRKYYKCVLVDFYFRGIPQKISQQAHFAFGGQAEITFRGYALNEDEIKKLMKEIDKSDLSDILQLVEGATTESLDKLQEEIDFFLNEDEEEEKKKKPKDTSNPFLALFGQYNEKEEKSEKKTEKKNDDDKPIKPDDWTEKTHIRPHAAKEAKTTAFDLFDIYKKAHAMPSYT